MEKRYKDKLTSACRTITYIFGRKIEIKLEDWQQDDWIGSLRLYSPTDTPTEQKYIVQKVFMRSSDSN